MINCNTLYLLINSKIYGTVNLIFNGEAKSELLNIFIH